MVPEDSLERLEELPGGTPGPSWGAFGTLLGRSWRVLGTLSGALGTLWGPVGALQAALRKRPGPSPTAKDDLGSIL